MEVSAASQSAAAGTICNTHTFAFSVPLLRTRDFATRGRYP